jgi:hypothetical protein
VSIELRCRGKALRATSWWQALRGEVRLVELVGSVWSWGSTYRWESDALASARERAIACKLLADIDMRL